MQTVKVKKIVKDNHFFNQCNLAIQNTGDWCQMLVPGPALPFSQHSRENKHLPGTNTVLSPGPTVPRVKLTTSQPVLPGTLMAVPAPYISPRLPLASCSLCGNRRRVIMYTQTVHDMH